MSNIETSNNLQDESRVNIELDGVNVQEESSAMDFAFEKVIAIILQSKQFHCSRDFLDELTDLTIRFLNDLVGSLSEYTRLQRRQKPALSDMKLLFNLKGIDFNEIAEEISLCRNFKKSQSLVTEMKRVENQIIQAQSERNNTEVEENSPSLPFIINEQYEITNLVPRLNTKPSYVPGYLPDFPPDFTYQSTPKYMETITDLKELRLKLVSESRMIEKPLYNLIESDDKKWRAKFEEELSEFEREKQDKKVEGTHVPETKSFDFIAYAQKRKSIAEKQKQDLDNRIKARETNLFMKAELYYSPYSTIRPTPEIESYFKNVITDGFKDVITSVRKAEREKQERTQKLLEERTKRERELEAQRKANEISINFNRMDDSSSSSSEDEAESEKVLEFMFEEDKEPESEPNIVVIGGENKTEPPTETTETTNAISFADIEADDDESSDDDMEDMEALLEAEVAHEQQLPGSTDLPASALKSSDEDSDDDMEDIL
ncbi:uncharacterized protein SPAPADRAFT_149783 [Spathaspora passalidarum NRRL Y-27907]|uniref:Transcription initiation factor TFIID subunit 8 n=1 Tax=Spathaspora passalidarum (strain NRRL Y-27907 / 11-Y1) TaxID=619300 RepID=G3ALU5_SPAPN|nr:uncharacterized protein SPAPADRAFT_149783 [Spathaspora passalidarum NRRL Y-27907]EGW32704.1 hypothetical protein SPAPADRAFT_149783 [Spathaspora passalidarum NRRL Y-27907]